MCAGKNLVLAVTSKDMYLGLKKNPMWNDKVNTVLSYNKTNEMH
jgi:hypothetical protein